MGGPLTPRPGYERLAATLSCALEQAQSGKGAARHAEGAQPFEDQPIMVMARQLGPAFGIGQAAKKDDERRRMTPADALREVYGAIIYLASVAMWLEDAERREK